VRFRIIIDRSGSIDAWRGFVRAQSDTSSSEKGIVLEGRDGVFARCASVSGQSRITVDRYAFVIDRRVFFIPFVDDPQSRRRRVRGESRFLRAWSDIHRARCDGESPSVDGVPCRCRILKRR
jgi:hypothetical protein